MNAAAVEIFKGADRVRMTPCMVAFEKWCADNRTLAQKVGVEESWRIFRAGWWTCEDGSAL